MTDYDKTKGKLKIERTLIGSYAKYKDIPKEYRRIYQITIRNGGYEVYECYGIVIPYTDEEKKDLEDKETERLIAERYSVKQELAILRQKETKPEEFDEYNAYAEECKAKAKALYKGD